MHFSRLLLRALVPFLLIQVVIPQELPFDIPVQLIGFPIIILAVRLSNFLKKLSYAVNPSTYRSRARRGSDHLPLSLPEIEKRLVAEMGDKVCVYEDVCVEYADKVNNDKNFVLDWHDIFRRYEKFPRGKREFYLLSVFMGDIVRSRDLCKQLAKRGRSCQTRNWSGGNNNSNSTSSMEFKAEEATEFQQQSSLPEQRYASQEVHRDHVEVHYQPKAVQYGLFGQNP